MDRVRVDFATAEKNVLLVEDDPFWQRAISDNLARASRDCHVSVASSAEEAIAKLNSDHHYNLVVADYYLAGDKTGYQLWCDCVKKGVNVPFLLTSGTVDLPAVAVKNLPVPFLPKAMMAAKLKPFLNQLGPQKFVDEGPFAAFFNFKYKFELLCVASAFALAMLVLHPTLHIEPNVQILPTPVWHPAPAPLPTLVGPTTPEPPAFRYVRENIFTPALMAQIDLILTRADEILALAQEDMSPNSATPRN